MKTFSVTRRQVLRGAGGVSLGLPLLPSLFPRRADGATPSLTGDKFFAAFATKHGGINPDNLYPADAALTQSREINPGHVAKYGVLSSRMEGNDRMLSNVLRAPAAKFGDKVLGKMNVMRGFDIPFYIGHHTGGHLGNFGRKDLDTPNLAPFATIDQVMAFSPKFYKTTAGVKQRSIVTGQKNYGMSWGWSNPTAGTGSLQNVQLETDSLSLFDKLVAGGPAKPTTPSAPPRKLIIDHVIENYRSLKNGNRRLSHDDKVRLDDHLSRLDELQRRLGTSGSQISASCTEFKKPAQGSNTNGLDGPAAASKFYGLLNEVIAMSFACGSSRIATLFVDSPFYDYSGSWHQDTAHRHEEAAAQMRLVAGLRNTFEGAILDLANRLDSIELAPGVTVLDQALVQWTHESGPSTHNPWDMPVVTFGRAGGYFKTGQFVDFRNLTPKSHLNVYGPIKQFTGLWFRQWLATALQSMGIPPADFEKNGKTGYGDAYWDAQYDKAVSPNVINRASDPIAIITA